MGKAPLETRTASSSVPAWTEKRREALSASSAVPHHSTRRRPLGGIVTCWVALLGLSSTKPVACSVTVPCSSLEVLFCATAASMEWSSTTRKRGVTGRTSNSLVVTTSTATAHTARHIAQALPIRRHAVARAHGECLCPVEGGKNILGIGISQG